jgi:hypothetical protein
VQLRHLQWTTFLQLPRQWPPAPQSVSVENFGGGATHFACNCLSRSVRHLCFSCSLVFSEEICQEYESWNMKSLIEGLLSRVVRGGVLMVMGPKLVAFPARSSVPFKIQNRRLLTSGFYRNTDCRSGQQAASRRLEPEHQEPISMWATRHGFIYLRQPRQYSILHSPYRSQRRQ